MSHLSPFLAPLSGYPDLQLSRPPPVPASASTRLSVAPSLPPALVDDRGRGLFSSSSATWAHLNYGSADSPSSPPPPASFSLPPFALTPRPGGCAFHLSPPPTTAAMWDPHPHHLLLLQEHDLAHLQSVGRRLSPPQPDDAFVDSLFRSSQSTFASTFFSASTSTSTSTSAATAMSHSMSSSSSSLTGSSSDRSATRGAQASEWSPHSPRYSQATSSAFPSSSSLTAPVAGHAWAASARSAARRPRRGGGALLPAPTPPLAPRPTVRRAAAADDLGQPRAASSAAAPTNPRGPKAHVSTVATFVPSPPPPRPPSAIASASTATATSTTRREAVESTAGKSKKRRRRRAAGAAAEATTTTTTTMAAARRTHARIYKWKLWTGDAHLQYFTQFSRLTSAFEESIWPYTVMHPSVMHEDTLRQSLQSNDESGADPLLFNVNILVALAARLVGDRNTEKEFYHRARTQLADLFDSQCIEVAEGLSAMSYYALGEANFNQFSYYNTLALRMCQRLGAYHTDAFSRSFYVFLLDPSNSFGEKKALVRSLRSLGPSAPRLPISVLSCFYDSSPDISPPSTPGAVAAASPPSPPAGDLYAQYLSARVSHVQNEEQRRKLYHQLRLSTIMATYTTNCTFLLGAYKSSRGLGVQPVAGEGGAAMGAGAGDDVYAQLMGVLDLYEADLPLLEDCGMAARMTSTLAWAALKTEAHWDAGHREQARRSALRFAAEVESFQRDIGALSCTSSMRFATVCSILLQCGEIEALRRTLDFAEPWGRGSTLAGQITTKFKNLLPPPPAQTKRKTAK